MIIKILTSLCLLMANASINTASSFLEAVDFETANGPKALIFISKDCPCSRSHIQHIKDISKNNPSIKVFAVSTDKLKGEEYFSYYKNLGLKVIPGEQKILIKKYKALKTPHVTLINNDKIVYEGGVTNHTNPDDATKFYFKDVFQAITQNKQVPYKKGRSLGCYIKRYM